MSSSGIKIGGLSDSMIVDAKRKIHCLFARTVERLGVLDCLRESSPVLCNSVSLVMFGASVAVDKKVHCTKHFASRGETCAAVQIVRAGV